MNVSGFARLAGSVSEAQVTDAAAALQRRHPALRAVVADRVGSAQFAIPEEPAPIPVGWKETAEPDAWIGTALAAGRTPFDVREGPLARVDVLAHPAGEWSDVVVTAHHVMADGRSIVTMLRELALLCAGEHLAENPSGVRAMPHIVASRGVVRPLLGVATRQLRLWPQLRRFPLADIRPQEMPVDADVIGRRVCAEGTTARLRQRARIERTTVYGALAAASILSLCELHDLVDRSVRIRSPIDIRDL